MKLYKVEVKRDEGKNYWDSHQYIVEASNFSNCEDKIKNTTDRAILRIELIGEAEKKDDVFTVWR
jgi:hypothetical protein